MINYVMLKVNFSNKIYVRYILCLINQKINNNKLKSC